MIKSILGGKSKNLFDISKVAQSEKLKNNGNGTLTVSGYGISAGILRDLCPNIKVGDTIKAYYTPISWTAPNPPRIISVSGHIMDRVANPSFVVTEADLNGKVYFYNNDYTERNLPGTTVIGNIFITNDTTVTAANYKDRYVPHELTSYKSIMKVSDVCQLINPLKLKKDTTVVNGLTIVYNGDGTYTVNGTSTNTSQAFFNYYREKGSYPFAIVDERLVNGYYAHNVTYDSNNGMYFWSYAGGKTFNNYILRPQIFYLTEMFGAGNEPKTVAEFKAKFPNDYYPYSPSCFVTSFDERMPCKTKNLFSSSTEVGTLEGGFGGPTVARSFEENKWYQGFATNGYYSPGNVPDFDIHPNSLYVYSKGSGYGMSRAIKCEPNTDYFISCSYSHISDGKGNVYIGYYDEGGNFISNLNMDVVYKITITTPSNCKWLIINFTTQGVGKAYFSDIQLVKGTTATDYVPYGYV